MAPGNVRVLTSRTCAYVTTYGSRHLGKGLGRFSWVSRWAQFLGQGEPFPAVVSGRRDCEQGHGEWHEDLAHLLALRAPVTGDRSCAAEDPDSAREPLEGALCGHLELGCPAGLLACGAEEDTSCCFKPPVGDRSSRKLIQGTPQDRCFTGGGTGAQTGWCVWVPHLSVGQAAPFLRGWRCRGHHATELQSAGSRPSC